MLRYRRTIAGDPRAFSIDADAAALAALIDHVGFERPHVVGHSYGGLVALGAVRATPSGFASLALLEPAPTGFLPPEIARGRDGADVPSVDGARPRTRDARVPAAGVRR